MQDREAAKFETLIGALVALRDEMLQLEASVLAGATTIAPAHHDSARNLAHYLALRRHDIREVQAQLAALGLSSLGRTESHVIGALQTVLLVLNKLSGNEEPPTLPAQTPGMAHGEAALTRNTEALLGPAPAERSVRIMVTMPSEAASDYELVRDLLASGMDCMRINCAHDGPEAWSGMVANLRRAEKETGRTYKIAMDLPGPKLRTGPIEPGPAVLKYRPKRDAYGHVLEPARIWLTLDGSSQPAPGPVDAEVSVTPGLLAGIEPGDRLLFADARGANRFMTITAARPDGCLAEATRTAYLVPGLPLERAPKREGQVASGRVGAIPGSAQTLRLNRGDSLILTRSPVPGRPAQFDEGGQLLAAARISVSLPEFFDSVRAGQPIWFDDGKIGGVVRQVSAQEVTVEIVHARPAGEKLGAEKGINVPETDLPLSALTSHDIEILPFVVRNADLVGYSFVRSERDVLELQARLAELGGEKVGAILKIETRQEFENLPQLLLAAMRSRAVGVMIARGDLAVECGYQRLAEVQEEILWVCEAAHVPVIWATQVLETLAKSGTPSRSEISDAAMGERAECVMLNKGPYVAIAVRTLDDILRRMQDHQEKKRSMLRQLHLAAAFHASAGT